MEQNIEHSKRFPLICQILHMIKWYVSQGSTETQNLWWCVIRHLLQEIGLIDWDSWPGDSNIYRAGLGKAGWNSRAEVAVCRWNFFFRKVLLLLLRTFTRLNLPPPPPPPYYLWKYPLLKINWIWTLDTSIIYLHSNT